MVCSDFLAEYCSLENCGEWNILPQISELLLVFRKNKQTNGERLEFILDGAALGVCFLNSENNTLL